MYEVLILLVLVNLGFTSYIWRTVRRGPKRKFLGKLLNGKPITPNHTPSSLRNGIDCGNSPTEIDHSLRFRDVCRRSKPQVRAKRAMAVASNLTLNSQAARPEYGRRYEIFYNEFSVGNLQIFASHHYGPADLQVGTEMRRCGTLSAAVWRNQQVHFCYR